MRSQYLLLIAILLLAPFVHAQQKIHAAIFRANRGPAGPGMVSLPYQVPDNTGNTWMIYYGGWLQQSGNQPLYSQGAMLNINGNQPAARGGNNQQAKMDEKSGEVIFENMQAGTFSVTRRVLVNKEENYVRYIDIIKNPQNQEQSVNVQFSTNLNYGVNASEMIADPRKKDQTIGWTAQTGAGRSVVEVYAGKGAENVPTISYQQGNSQVQAAMPVTIPAGKEVAIIHMHATCDSTEAGNRFAQNIRETKILASLPIDLRRIVVNFPPSQGFVGDRELLRGDLFDVVEIRGGDQMKGTLKEPVYKLNTFYGNVDIPAQRVIGLFNVGDYRPRQLVVTVDGEVFGGQLAKQTIELQLGSGQTTQIPLSQITRIGYRKRAGEPEEWTFDKPFVAMRSGDRMGIVLPRSAIEVVTRYGSIKLDPKTISAIAFQSEEHGVHDIFLTDGSKFAGIVNAAEFEMKLSGSVASTTAPSSTPPAPPAAEQIVHFPSSAVARIQLAGPPPEIDESNTPILALLNEDQLVGIISGQMKLDTAFDTLTLNGNEIKKLIRAKDAGLDVQVTLWDSSIVSGQLENPILECQLKSGATIKVPVALVQEYNQPLPQPAGNMVEKIRATVVQLNADDWKERDRAEQELTSMGSVVISVLKDMRAAQPPEAQQRIDQIIAAVSGKKPEK